MTKKFNRFGYIYSKIRDKHPDWTHNQLVRSTLYVIRGV